MHTRTYAYITWPVSTIGSVSDYESLTGFRLSGGCGFEPRAGHFLLTCPHRWIHNNLDIWITFARVRPVSTIGSVSDYDDPEGRSLSGGCGFEPRAGHVFVFIISKHVPTSFFFVTWQYHHVCRSHTRYRRIQISFAVTSPLPSSLYTYIQLYIHICLPV